MVAAVSCTTNPAIRIPASVPTALRADTTMTLELSRFDIRDLVRELLPADRLLALLERTAAYYVRVLWESAEAAGGNTPRAISGSANGRTSATACLISSCHRNGCSASH